MGKSGDALRAAKQEKLIVHWSRKQLEEHDRQVIMEQEERIRSRMRAEFQKERARIDQEIAEEWKKREELFSDNGTETMFNLLAMTVAVPVAVLIDEFGWKPLPEGRRHHPDARLARFVEKVQDKLNDIAGDTNQDIRVFCEEVYQKSGVKLMREG